MNKQVANTTAFSKTHASIIPKQEVRSIFHALTLYVPLVILYLARHLTIGSYIRLRRVILRRLGKVYYV